MYEFIDFIFVLILLTVLAVTTNVVLMVVPVDQEYAQFLCLASTPTASKGKVVPMVQTHGRLEV
jgi:hypothetical protein